MWRKKLPGIAQASALRRLLHHMHCGTPSPRRIAQRLGKVRASGRLGEATRQVVFGRYVNVCSNHGCKHSPRVATPLRAVSRVTGLSESTCLGCVRCLALLPVFSCRPDQMPVEGRYQRETTKMIPTSIHRNALQSQDTFPPAYAVTAMRPTFTRKTHSVWATVAGGALLGGGGSSSVEWRHTRVPLR